MITYDDNILEEKFNSLPEKIQQALNSVEVANIIKEISEKNGLHVDQLSTLFSLTSYVLLGLIPTTEFSKILSKEIGIEIATSKKIATEINEMVFGELKKEMQKDQDMGTEQDISPIEQVGGFSIEKEPVNTTGGENMGSTNKDDILSEMEEHMAEKVETTTQDKHENLTEPLVDQLLQGSVATKETGVKKVYQDPYKEQV